MIARSTRTALAALVLLPLAAACTPDRPPTGTSVPPPVTSVAPDPPTPSASPTPSQEELSAQAEKAYRTASEEMERLGRAGGADEASPLLRTVVTERALVKYETLLKDQKRRGYTVTGRGTTYVLPKPGATSKDYDPRLSLEVCDDRSAVTWSEGGKTNSGYPVQGWVYGRVIDGKVMIVDVVTAKVEKCALS